MALEQIRMNNLTVLTKAVSFAAAKHTLQKRKGDAGEPYFNHLAEVASLVAAATNGEDGNLIAAAYLHDTIEDTDTTYEDLELAFTTDIANLVREMTDDKSLPKEERKRLQIQNALKHTKRCQILKAADKISNLRSLAASPPTDWSTDRRSGYIRWAIEVVEQLKGNNSWLDERFADAVKAAGDTISLRA